MDINTLSLTFDEKTLMNDLIKHLVEGMENVVNKLVSEMKSNCQSNVIDDSWVNLVVYDVAKETIESEVGNTHWWAFIDNYGTGSQMDKDLRNPWWLDYVNDDDFNHERKGRGYHVLSRPKAEYNTYNWKDGKGYKTGRGKGYLNEFDKPLSLEAVKWKKSGEPRYKAQPPAYWFDNAWDKYAELMFKEAIEEGINTFQFDSNKYLKGVN